MWTLSATRLLGLARAGQGGQEGTTERRRFGVLSAYKGFVMFTERRRKVWTQSHTKLITESWTQGRVPENILEYFSE